MPDRMGQRFTPHRTKTSSVFLRHLLYGTDGASVSPFMGGFLFRVKSTSVISLPKSTPGPPLQPFCHGATPENPHGSFFRGTFPLFCFPRRVGVKEHFQDGLPTSRCPPPTPLSPTPVDRPLGRRLLHRSCFLWTPASCFSSPRKALVRTLAEPTLRHVKNQPLPGSQVFPSFPTWWPFLRCNNPL